MGEVDPFQLIDKLVTSLGTNPLGAGIQKAVAVLPRPKSTPTNVSLGYGTMNEVAANGGTPGTQDSIDGALYICTINKDKIKPEAIPIVFVHIGQHVGDLEQTQTSPAYLLEYNAWVSTTEAAAAFGQKYMTLPGGYLMWNYKWPESEQVNNMSTALGTFMSKEEMLDK
jgi:hypothetical protein